MRNKPLLFGIVACSLFFSPRIQATNYYVSPKASGNGTNWENATSLDQALLSATGTDTIFVAAGEYTAQADSSFTCTESHNGVVVIGSQPQDGIPILFANLADTSLITSHLIGNGKSVITINNSTVKWIGFEITGGTAQMGAGVYNAGGTLECCIIHSNNAELTKFDKGGGAGVFNTGVIQKCVIRNNVISTVKTNGGGGGVYNTAGGVVCDSYIHSNKSEQIGGGIASTSDKSCIINCEVTNNVASSMGGGIYMDSTTIRNVIVKKNILQSPKKGTGGGIYALSACLIDSCIIEENIAADNIAAKGMHGGVSLNGKSRIQNSIIRKNICMLEGSEIDGVFGGGLGLANESEAINCLIVQNETNGAVSASTKGGGVTCNTNSKVINCTVVGNTSAGRGGGIHLDDGYISNSIIWGNYNDLTSDAISPDIRLDGQCTMKNTLYQYRNREPDVDELNILCENPLFRDLENGDYRLTMESPAVNAGNADENPLTIDLAGEQRVAAGAIDLGAYELIYFSIALPESMEGASINTDGYTAFKGEDYAFTLIRDTLYDESMPKVTTNRPEDGELYGGEGSDGVFHYTINNILSDIIVTIEGLEINPERIVTLPETIEGLTLQTENGNVVRSGQDYSFSLILDEDYDESTLEVAATRDGAQPEILTANDDGLYTITDIRTNVTVAINGVTLNPERTVTLPKPIEGLTFNAETENTTLRSGQDFVFSLLLDADYDESELIVEVTRGDQKETLTLTDGKYVIADIRTDVIIAISGVTLNPERTITLPSVKGATITPTTASNKIRSGHDFEFTLTLNEGYEQSTPIVSIDREGIASEILIPQSEGKYVIAEVRTDIVVTIDGVVENPSGLDAAPLYATHIYVHDGILYVKANSIIDIYTLSGMKWTTMQVNGTAQFSLPCGIYIVHHGKQFTKVAIK